MCGGLGVRAAWTGDCGVVNSAPLNVVLGMAEYMWHSQVYGQNAFGFHFDRWRPDQCIRAVNDVDDVVGASPCFCGDCLAMYLKVLYRLTISPCNGTLATASKPCVWIDIELTPLHRGLFCGPKTCQSSVTVLMWQL